MPKEHPDVFVTVEITNVEAINAFANGLHLLREAVEDLPWRDDLSESLEEFKKAIEAGL